MSAVRVWRTPPGIPPAAIALLGSEKDWRPSDLRCATFLKPSQRAVAKIMDCGYDKETDTLFLGLPFTEAPILEKYLAERATELHDNLEDLPIWDMTAHVKWAGVAAPIG